MKTVLQWEYYESRQRVVLSAQNEKEILFKQGMSVEHFLESIRQLWNEKIVVFDGDEKHRSIRS